MTLTVRRVITGHDQNGHAIVAIDEIAKNVTQGRPGAHAAVIWTSEGFPVDNGGDADAVRPQGRHHARQRHRVPRGELRPRRHAAQPPHRLDRLRGGDVGRDRHGARRRQSVHLKAGDVLVQRGTIHNWVNKGTEPCVIAFVLVAAKPVTAGGKVLNAVG